MLSSFKFCDDWPASNKTRSVNNIFSQSASLIFEPIAELGYGLMNLNNELSDEIFLLLISRVTVCGLTEILNSSHKSAFRCQVSSYRFFTWRNILWWVLEPSHLSQMQKISLWFFLFDEQKLLYDSALGTSVSKWRISVIPFCVFVLCRSGKQFLLAVCLTWETLTAYDVHSLNVQVKEEGHISLSKLLSVTSRWFQLARI